MINLRTKLYHSIREKYKSIKFWKELILLLLFFISLSPILYSLISDTFSEARLLHSFITLTMAIFLLIRSEHTQIVSNLEFNYETKKTLLLSTIFLFLNVLINYITLGFSDVSIIFLKINTLIIISCIAFGLASIIFFTFGTSIAKITYSSTAVFIIFLFLSSFINNLDFPLRTLAAIWSVNILELLNNSINLYIFNAKGYEPYLIIENYGKSYNVASECNGFGIILNSLLVSQLLSMYKNLNLFENILNLIAAVFVGFSMNILRIISIILIAPYFINNYNIIHEIIGVIYYFSSFFITWYLLKGPLMKSTN